MQASGRTPWSGAFILSPESYRVPITSSVASLVLPVDAPGGDLLVRVTGHGSTGIHVLMSHYLAGCMSARLIMLPMTFGGFR